MKRVTSMNAVRGPTRWAGPQSWRTRSFVLGGGLVCESLYRFVLVMLADSEILLRGVELPPPLGSAVETDVHAATTTHSVAKVEAIRRQYTLPVTTSHPVIEIEPLSGDSSLRQQRLPPTTFIQPIHPTYPTHTSTMSVKHSSTTTNIRGRGSHCSSSTAQSTCNGPRLDHHCLRHPPLRRRRRRRQSMSMSAHHHNHSKAHHPLLGRGVRKGTRSARNFQKKLHLLLGRKKASTLVLMPARAPTITSLVTATIASIRVVVELPLLLVPAHTLLNTP